MAIIYTHPDIDFGKNTKDITQERQSVFVDSAMDFGTHTRAKGTATVKSLSITRYLRREQVELFHNLMDTVGAGIFYSTFPDPTYPMIDSSKYYAFSFIEDNIQEKWIAIGWYTASIKLYWHFRIPPIERI